MGKGTSGPGTISSAAAKMFQRVAVAVVVVVYLPLWIGCAEQLTSKEFETQQQLLASREAIIYQLATLYNHVHNVLTIGGKVAKYHHR